MELEKSDEESYMHYYAKMTFINWLRTSNERFGPLYWTSNRGAPYFGIYEEYPISSDHVNDDQVWDEWDYEEEWEDFIPLGWELKRKDDIPTREELMQFKSPLLCVIDIAIQHKGCIKYAIEIVHTSPTPDWKLEILNNSTISVYEVSAKSILSETGVPTNPSSFMKKVGYHDEYFSKPPSSYSTTTKIHIGMAEVECKVRSDMKATVNDVKVGQRSILSKLVKEDHNFPNVVFKDVDKAIKRTKMILKLLDDVKNDSNCN